MNAILHNRAQAFLQNLDRLSATGQHDAFINEVLESNGHFTPPKHDRSHLWELHLHGINATGAIEEEAIANWKRLATKAMPDDCAGDGNFIAVQTVQNQISGGAA